LLLDHLYLFVEGLQVQMIQLIKVLEEDPGRGECGTIQKLHQAFHGDWGTGTVKRFEGDGTEVWKFFKHILSRVMSGDALEKYGWFFS